MSEPFLCAPGMRVEAQEKLVDVRFTQVAERLNRIEEMIERLEKRLWLTVYGVVAVILAEAFQSVLTVSP